jgi:hypothetical protein
MSRRKSFTEHRRARSALKVDRLDRLQTRNTITEPVSVTGLSVTALRGLALIGVMGTDDALSAATGGFNWGLIGVSSFFLGGLIGV